MRFPQGAEWIIILVLILLLFGAKRLPDMARSLGRSARILKAETKGMRDDEGDDEQPQAQAAAPAPAALPATPPTAATAPAATPPVTEPTAPASDTTDTPRS